MFKMIGGWIEKAQREEHLRLVENVHCMALVLYEHFKAVAAFQSGDGLNLMASSIPASQAIEECQEIAAYTKDLHSLLATQKTLPSEDVRDVTNIWHRLKPIIDEIDIGARNAHQAMGFYELNHESLSKKVKKLANAKAIEK